MEKTHRLRWAEMRPSERRDAAVSFIGQVLKWAFVGAMCIFTLYPVIYTLLGSFKTNAELTLGGGILPEKWQIENYIYAFQKLEFGKYTLNSVVLGPADRVVHSYDCFDGCIYHCPQRVPGQKTAHHKLSAQHVHLRGFCGAVSAVRPSACRRTHQ